MATLISLTAAQVAELVDALVSGTSGESRGGSSPLLGTKRPRCLWSFFDNSLQVDFAGFFARMVCAHPPTGALAGVAMV